MEIIIASITGFASGLHASTWGMFKDSPHEGFTWLKYFRSAIIGTIYAVLLYYLFEMISQKEGIENPFNLSKASGIFLLFGSAYVVERITLEVWKTFLRTEDQSKYFIPMQLHVGGKVVNSKPKRYLLACCYVGGIVFVGWGIFELWEYHKSGMLDWNPYLILLLLSVGGWISAFGGTWKDAPIEGFELFKFFRSPGAAYFYALVAAHLTDNFLVITLCSIGFTIATMETHKTFMNPEKPRGKFAGMPINFPEMKEKRKKFVYVYALLWLYVLFFMVMAFVEPHEGLVGLI
ncbi:MAG: hypothetical protein ABEH43_01525 [Flavobacteriales bacterium]